MPRLRSLLTLLCVICTLQLGLLYVQGLQLHRQHEALLCLRGDLQDLTESIDQLQGNQGQEEEAWSPSRSRLHARGRLLRVHQEPKPAEEEGAAKELRESRDSAQKAVQEVRQAQKKLSLEEASKRAEEKQKIEAAENAWMKWVWGGLAVVVAALLLRGWLRNR
jgi:hypothetical protein